MEICVNPSRFLLRFHELHVGDAGLGLDVGEVGAGGVRAEVDEGQKM